MRFELIPQEPSEVEAKFFEPGDAKGVANFLYEFGINAEVSSDNFSGTGRGISPGFRIRTIFANNSRTIKHRAPCWVAVSSVEWVEMYSDNEFHKKFREK